MKKVLLKKERVKLQEEAEKILEMGQDSEVKAAKSVIELSNQAEKNALEEENKVLDILSTKRKFQKVNYKEALAVYMKNLLREEGIPSFYHFMISDLPKGIGLVVWKEPDKILGRRRLEVIGEPIYDRHAAMLFAYWAGDIIYKDYKNAIVV